jgi:thioredoxin-related protein
MFRLAHTFDRLCTLYGRLPILAALLLTGAVHATDADPHTVDDRPLEESIILPDWFKLSFLELHDDLTDAVKQGKKGLIIYFGQKDCPYCKAHLQNNWGRPDIRTYTQKHFDVIAIDVRGNRPVTGIDGYISSENDFSIRHEANFTPTMMFYDANGKNVLKLPGYHPPYQFRAALEFVAGGHYRKESFRSFLARADSAFTGGNTALNEDALFVRPPYALDRSRFPGQTPLVVVFEQSRCHACDVLHAGPMQDPAVRTRLAGTELVQLDMWSDTTVLTPDGRRLTARKWAEQLDIFYTPTIMFFDERGKEIIRVDSVVGLLRLRNVLDYVSGRGYEKYTNYQEWRRANKLHQP